jgi:hypothetical protein
MSFAPIIFTEFDAAKRNRRVLFVLIAALSLAFLTGCGGAWQPDPRDGPQSPARSSVESSGITGPDDSR